MICTFKTKLQTLQSCVFSSDNRETNQQNIFPPEFEISQCVGWIKSPKVFLVVGQSMHHHPSQLPMTRVITIETLLIVFSSRHLFTIMVPVPWVTMWSTMSCHTLPSRQGNITWPSPQSTPTNPHISSWLLDESFAIAAAYHDGITVTLTTSRLFRLAKVTRWLTLAFSDIGHVSQVWSHSVMCWELKNGVKDVTSDNFPSAIAFSFFTFKVKSLRAYNPCLMIQYQNSWSACIFTFIFICCRHDTQITSATLLKARFEQKIFSNVRLSLVKQIILQIGPLPFKAFEGSKHWLSLIRRHTNSLTIGLCANECILPAWTLLLAERNNHNLQLLHQVIKIISHHFSFWAEWKRSHRLYNCFWVEWKRSHPTGCTIAVKLASVRHLRGRRPWRYAPQQFISSSSSQSSVFLRL